jgi:hypothetical protein
MKKVKRWKDDTSRMTLLALKYAQYLAPVCASLPICGSLARFDTRGVHQFLEGSIAMWEIQDGSRSVPHDLKLSVDAERNQGPLITG